MPLNPAAPPGPRTTPGLGGGHAAGSACPHLASLFNITPGPRRRRCSPSLGGVGTWGGWGHGNKNLGCSRGKCGVVYACATALPAPAPLPRDWVVSLLKGRSPSPPAHGGRVTAPPLQQRWQQGSGTQMALLGRDVALPSRGGSAAGRGFVQPPQTSSPLAQGPTAPPRPGSILFFPGCGMWLSPATASVSGPRSGHGASSEPRWAGPRCEESGCRPRLPPVGPPQAKQGLNGSFGTGGGTSVR